MRKYWIVGAILCLMALAVGTIWSQHKPDPEKLWAAAEEKQLTPEEKADRIVSRMTDAQKIGQLMMIGIQGTTLDADAKYMLTAFPNGNVIFFDRNMDNPEQVKTLTGEIQKTVKEETGLPPFIGIDQEGGQVMRMRS